MQSNDLTGKVSKLDANLFQRFARLMSTQDLSQHLHDAATTGAKVTNAELLTLLDDIQIAGTDLRALGQQFKEDAISVKT
jgi:hypothetical protein